MNNNEKRERDQKMKVDKRTKDYKRAHAKKVAGRPASGSPAVRSPAIDQRDFDLGFVVQSRIGRIRVGRDYQAVLPPVIPVADRPKEGPCCDNPPTLERCICDKFLIWSPPVHISETALDEYINLAKTKYKYTSEQSLGMLFWHRYDIQKAILDLPNFQPNPDKPDTHKFLCAEDFECDDNDSRFLQSGVCEVKIEDQL